MCTLGQFKGARIRVRFSDTPPMNDPLDTVIIIYNLYWYLPWRLLPCSSIKPRSGWRKCHLPWWKPWSSPPISLCYHQRSRSTSFWSSFSFFIRTGKAMQLTQFSCLQCSSRWKVSTVRNYPITGHPNSGFILIPDVFVCFGPVQKPDLFVKFYEMLKNWQYSRHSVIEHVR